MSSAFTLLVRSPHQIRILILTDRQLFFPRPDAREAARKFASPTSPNLVHRRTTSSLPRYHVRDPSPKFPVTVAVVDDPFQYPGDSSQHSLDLHHHHPHHRQLSDHEIGTAGHDAAHLHGESAETVQIHALKPAGPLDSPVREELSGLPANVVHPYVCDVSLPPASLTFHSRSCPSPRPLTFGTKTTYHGPSKTLSLVLFCDCHVLMKHTLYYHALYSALTPYPPPLS